MRGTAGQAAPYRTIELGPIGFIGQCCSDAVWLDITPWVPPLGLLQSPRNFELGECRPRHHGRRRRQGDQIRGADDYKVRRAVLGRELHRVQLTRRRTWRSWSPYPRRRHCSPLSPEQCSPCQLRVRRTSHRLHKNAHPLATPPRSRPESRGRSCVTSSVSRGWLL